MLRISQYLNNYMLLNVLSLGTSQIYWPHSVSEGAVFMKCREGLAQ